MEYIDYFKNLNGFHRFFELAKQKYYSYGDVVGSIYLKCLSFEEAQAFTDFFGKKYLPGDSASIRVKDFYKVLLKTRFKDFDFLTFFKAYFDDFQESSNLERKLKEQSDFDGFMEDIIQKMNSFMLKDYFLHHQDSNLEKLIHKNYRKNKEELKNQLLMIDILLHNIPDKITYLPIYASLTSNPHFLDFQTSTCNLFLRILSGILGEDYPVTNQDKINLFFKINVYNDPSSNFVITYNLKGDALLEDTYKKLGSLNLNIENIMNINHLTGVNHMIFVFENPSILNYLKTKNYDISVIITSGIPNLAFYKLMEVISCDTIFYYNGDFDPEGLLIAQKLMDKYPRFKAFLYQESDYIACSPRKKISQSSLVKLDHVTHPDLLEVKSCLIKDKVAGYQENNLDKIEHFIKDKL